MYILVRTSSLLLGGYRPSNPRLQLESCCCWEATTEAAMRERDATEPLPTVFTICLAAPTRTLMPGVTADITIAFVAGDSIYGDNRPLRQWPEERMQSYVLAVSTDEGATMAAMQRRSMRPVWRMLRPVPIYTNMTSWNILCILAIVSCPIIRPIG